MQNTVRKSLRWTRIRDALVVENAGRYNLGLADVVYIRKVLVILYGINKGVILHMNMRIWAEGEKQYFFLPACILFRWPVKALNRKDTLEKEASLSQIKKQKLSFTPL